MICVGGNPFFGPTTDFEIALKTAFFKIFVCARNGTFVNNNHVLRPLYNGYFCHITIVKWSQITKKIHQKVHFLSYFYLGPFFIKFPIVTLKTYHHRKERATEAQETVLEMALPGEQLGRV